MAWESLFKNLELFNKVSKECSVFLGYEYPPYDNNVSKYVMDMFEEYSKQSPCASAANPFWIYPCLITEFVRWYIKTGTTH